MALRGKANAGVSQSIRRAMRLLSDPFRQELVALAQLVERLAPSPVMKHAAQADPLPCMQHHRSIPAQGTSTTLQLPALLLRKILASPRGPASASCARSASSARAAPRPQSCAVATSYAHPARGGRRTARTATLGPRWGSCTCRAFPRLCPRPTTMLSTTRGLGFSRTTMPRRGTLQVPLAIHPPSSPLSSRGILEV